MLAFKVERFFQFALNLPDAPERTYKIMNKTKKKLPHICFIGCGSIAAKHAFILRKNYPKMPISFASSTQKKAEIYRKKLKGRHAFAGYDKALSSGVFDIAFITTPHHLHSELAVLAANNGKNIIIEKPVTRNTVELEKIEAAVKRNKVRCTVAENYYYKPMIRKLKDFINKGYIGDLLFIELNRMHKNTVTGWRTESDLMGGGALLEGGVHWVNALVSLSNSEPAEVIAFKPDVDYQTNVPFEDCIQLSLKFRNGAVGKLVHSWAVKSPFKGMNLSKISGTKGSIIFESNGLFYFMSGKKSRIGFRFSDFLGFRAMHRSFIESYINDKPWEPSLDRIKLELKIVEAAYRSLKSKKVELV